MRIPFENEPDSLHRALRMLGCAHRHRIHDEFAGIGLTEGQPKILGYLTWNDGCIQRELAENCHIKASTVTSILANMEKAGLIRRESSKKDRRILNVYLTDKGKEAHQRIDKIFGMVENECFEGFTEEEKLKTFELMNRLQKNLQRKGANQPKD